MKKLWLCGALLLIACAHGIQTDADEKRTVWIDTDPSVRPGGHEVDDGFALVQALHSSELEIRGVSVVFGNAEFDIAWPVGQYIVKVFGPKSLEVYPGAAGAEELGKETAASRAMASALEKEPLTIVALGPVTNVGTVIRNHPEAIGNIERIIAVAGRRPGQRFRTGTRELQPFMDFNFELDVEAFRVILESNVPVVLAPWEVSSKAWVREAELERLEKGNGASRWLALSARDWLNWWKETFGVDGFNPFDTLAVTYVTSPELIQSEELPAEIQVLPDDRGNGGDAVKPYLIVSKDLSTSRMVTYCHTPESGFVEDLMARLLKDPR